MSDFSFLPVPILESSRLILREINNNDVVEIFALRSNPLTMKYIPRPLIKDYEGALEHIKNINETIKNNQGINWAITLKGNSKMIGIIGHYRIKWEHFRTEIGYMILPEFEGKGFTSEAIPLMIDYGFNEMNMHSIEARVDPSNHASARVLEKNGFVKEAHLKENEFFEGKFLDTVIYSLIKPA
jgi:[ribosomal protein S5]-alanine N-acetyltransferase